MRVGIDPSNKHILVGFRLDIFKCQIGEGLFLCRIKSNFRTQHTSVCVDVSNVFNLDLTQESTQHTSVCVDVSNVFNLGLTQEPHYVQKTP